MPKSLSNTKTAMIRDQNIEEMCFVEWAKHSSLVATKKALENLGVITSGGKPLDATVISRRAYHWLAFHPNAARKYLAELANLKFADDDWINYWVSKSMMGLVSESEVLAWIREYNVIFHVDTDAQFPPDSDTER